MEIMKRMSESKLNTVTCANEADWIIGMISRHYSLIRNSEVGM